MLPVEIWVIEIIKMSSQNYKTLTKHSGINLTNYKILLKEIKKDLFKIER